MSSRQPNSADDAQIPTPLLQRVLDCDYPDVENYLALLFQNLQLVGSNYTHYVNPQFDALFEKSQQIIDPVERNKAYTQLDSLRWQMLLS